ncbi:hypothetical protein MGYG_03122 [Nannizzia gypsea CBS 118893]|uniref:Aminoglycoside phosphotransferase domain-containing protein n=1 Tax=Arthroderma gypseum (strain ATCC MYA-4604 / CBS 118893) TaxID=535722 RepID=E4UR01_ARTGP|nr:hypothetical protein MGYG_03122 [Nannizzia gypsea CBS 118893]EFR00116.1 hypothetical protein MGYG_03122 [Nannizzia gypsea CBS 118893]
MPIIEEFLAEKGENLQKLFSDRLGFELPSPTTSKQARGLELQPGCVPIPEGTESFILRLTNSDADGMKSTNRVENEVAVLSLASTALTEFRPNVVPSVYAWSTAAGTTQGWILQQRMPGSSILEAFSEMNLENQKPILAQMARILKALQDYPLPDSITDFGGLTFDGSGHIVSASMTNVGAGPWSSYEDFFRTRLQIALEKADKSQHIQGWHANGIRKRLDAFIEHGLHSQFESLAYKDKRVIAHNDFSEYLVNQVVNKLPSLGFFNLLIYSTSKLRIIFSLTSTGTHYYDFSCISHPSYEYFCSFLGAGEQLPGWCEDQDSDQAKLRHAKLHGFPSPLFPTTEGGINWEVVRACEEELEKVDALRPRTMAGIDKVADINALLSTILPWRLSNSDILAKQSQDTVERYRKIMEVQLAELLQHMGY